MCGSSVQRWQQLVAHQGNGKRESFVAGETFTNTQVSPLLKRANPAHKNACNVWIHTEIIYRTDRWVSLWLNITAG